MLDPSKARAILDRCNANANFFALPASVVEALLAEADSLKYRRPKNANGSRGRYFHAYLSRRADSLTGMAREQVRGQNATVTLKRGGRSVTASGI